MNNNKGLIALAVVLGLALIGALIWGFNRQSQAETLASEKEELTTEYEQMTQLRDDLASQVDSLSVAYEDLATENTNLSGSLANTQGELQNAQNALARAKRNSAAEINDLRAQIQELIEARSGLESSLVRLQTENDSLRTRTGVLEVDLDQARNENETLAQMNEAMQGEVNRLTLANFKATAFNVELQQRNEKVTARSGRARRIVVNFDLASVPEKYQGVRPIYLVVTDANGNAINPTAATKATATVNGQTMELLAQEIKEVNIEESQRLSFTHELDEKLDDGFYRVSVFTDIGLLGASNFSLR
jgi:chromosome segregation ATPase